MSAATSVSGQASWTEDFGRAWNDFWFRPSDPTLVSLLRIGVGLVALLHLGSYFGDLVRWFGTDGLLPLDTVSALLGVSAGKQPSFLSASGSAALLWSCWGIGLIAALALTLGLFSRSSAAITALVTLAITNRAPIISGHVEPPLVFMLLYLCVAPAGAKFSIDSLLRSILPEQSFRLFIHRDEPSFLATLSLRLMQVHLAAFTLMMALSKTYGDAWWDGAAVWNLLAQTHSRPMDLTVLRGNEYLLNAWTHFIAWTQLLFPFLVWSRLTRPIMLAAAAVMWLSLLPLTGLTSFCLLMLVGVACFIPTETFARWQAASQA